ncbi:DUF6722 family protein [Candidatus Symbiothrix dinenymphae]|uniref:DUF6722 family protein n=1 Tax=Candidatus Symbiothrix dinenymphae TaxID=467085 RepID=UPI00070361F6|nr:DUF6722 family protein [Candidatus Symbiothrix dinenymphae]
MKKELGKWLMDISKYVVTGVLLTSILGDIKETRIIYIIGVITVVATLSLGLFLTRDTKNTKEKNKRRK